MPSAVLVPVPVVVPVARAAGRGRARARRADAVHRGDDGVDGGVRVAGERARDGREERGVEHREELRGAAEDGLRGDGRRGGGGAPPPPSTRSSAA